MEPSSRARGSTVPGDVAARCTDLHLDRTRYACAPHGHRQPSGSGLITQRSPGCQSCGFACRDVSSTSDVLLTTFRQICLLTSWLPDSHLLCASDGAGAQWILRTRLSAVSVWCLVAVSCVQEWSAEVDTYLQHRYLINMLVVFWTTAIPSVAPSAPSPRSGTERVRAARGAGVEWQIGPD